MALVIPTPLSRRGNEGGDVAKIRPDPVVTEQPEDQQEEGGLKVPEPLRKSAIDPRSEQRELVIPQPLKKEPLKVPSLSPEAGVQVEEPPPGVFSFNDAESQSQLLPSTNVDDQDLFFEALLEGGFPSSAVGVGAIGEASWQVIKGVVDGVRISWLRAMHGVSNDLADALSDGIDLSEIGAAPGQVFEEALKEQYKKQGLTPPTIRVQREIDDLIEQGGESLPRQLAQTATRFAIPYTVYSRVVGPSPFLKNYVAGTLADITAFSATEERAANLVADAGIPFASAAAARLAADPDDAGATAVFKQAVEGIILSKLTETTANTLARGYHAVQGVAAKRAGAAHGASPDIEGMPRSTPPGFDLEKADEIAATEAQTILSEKLRFRVGVEDPVDVATSNYIERLTKQGIWENLSPEDQVAKTEWFRGRARSVWVEGKGLERPPEPFTVDAVEHRMFQKQWEDNLREASRIKDADGGLTPKKIKDFLDTTLLDTSGPLKRALRKSPGGQIAVDRFNAIAGARTHAAMVNITASQEVFRKKVPGTPIWTRLPEEDLKALNRISMIRRFRQIRSMNPEWSEKGNPMSSHDPAFYGRELKRMKDELGEVRYSELYERSSNFFKYPRLALGELLESGVIAQSEYRALSRFQFAPIQYLDKLDPVIAKVTGPDGRSISVSSSGIQPLSRGAQKVIETDSELFLEQILLRSYSRAANNRANLALFDVAKRNDNPVVRTKIPKGDAKNAWVSIKVMENGKPKKMFLAREYASQWAGSPQDFSVGLFRTFSGAPITRFFATGPGNPEFALGNFPRDMMYNGLVSGQYSGFIPRAISQYQEDIKEVMGDAVFRRGAYLDYIKEGGGMELLTQQGITKATKPGFNQLQAFEDAAAFLNTSSEIINRLAVRNRAIKNIRAARAKEQGIAPEDVVLSPDDFLNATTTARGVIDYAQGGSAIKRLNEVVPYLNPAVQGLRGVGRISKENPAKAGAYAVQLLGIYAGIRIADRAVNPEASAEIPSYVRDNFMAFTTPYSFIDSEGDRRYLGIRIPIDHGTIGLKVLADALVDKSMNAGLPTDAEVKAIDRVIGALGSTFGVVPGVSLPPTAAGVVAYAANHDWWRQTPAYTGEPGVPAAMEFTPGRTPEFLRDVGGAANLSPDRLESAIRQVLPDNIYTNLVGGAYRHMTEGIERDILDPVEKHQIEKLRGVPFIRRITFLTSPQAKESNRIIREVEEARGESVVISRQVRALGAKVNAEEMTLEEGLEFITKEMPVEAQGKARESLINDVNLEQAFKTVNYSDQSIHLPSRRWWKHLSSAPPVARAKELVTVLAAMDNLPNDKERREAKRAVEEIMKQAPGFSPKDSPEFAFAFKKALEQEGMDGSAFLR